MLRTHKDDIRHMQDFFIMCGRLLEREEEVKTGNKARGKFSFSLGDLFSNPSLSITYLLVWGMMRHPQPLGLFLEIHTDITYARTILFILLEESCSCLFIRMVCDSVSLAFTIFNTLSILLSQKDLNLDMDSIT